jgi:hypothetical protein
VRVVLNGDDVRLLRYNEETNSTDFVRIGDSADWRGSPKQVAMLVTPVPGTATIRVRVYLGAATDAFEALTMLVDHIFSVSSSMNATTNRPTATPAGIYRWDWWFDRPASDDFRMWSYTTEFGWVDEFDASDSVTMTEVVRARTSYEVPLLEPVYETDFSEFANFAAFLSAKPWMFTTGGEDATFVTTQPYTGGANAWRSKFRLSPLSNPLHSSPTFTGGLAGTTSWYSRQVFELPSTFAPSMTLGSPRDGIRASQIAMYDGGSDYDYSTITLDGTEVRHVWDAFTGAHDTTTVIDAVADWKGAPVQVVHWVERVTSTTVRVRIWFGLASVPLGLLPQIYDEVHTSSFTNPTMYQTTMWSAFDTTEYPSSDAWLVYLYQSQQGTVDYFSDGLVVYDELLSSGLSAEDIPGVVQRALTTVSNGVVLTPLAGIDYTAIANLTDRSVITSAPAMLLRLAVTLLSTTQLREQVRPELATRLGDTLSLADALSLVRAVRVLDGLGILTALAVTSRYALQTGDTLRLTPAVLTFFGGTVTDAIALGDAPFETGRLRAVATDGALLTDTVAPRFFIRADVADGVELTPVQLLQWVWRPTVEDTITLQAGLLLPDGSFITWVTNTRTGATANYSNYEYTSFAQRGTHYLATREDGLYRLDGDTDNGVDIIAELRSGFLQFAGGKFTSFAGIYLGVHGTGALFLKLLTGDEKSYTYRVIAQNMETTKVRVGKGLRARYFAFELVSSGQDFDLDTVEFLPLGAQRRV